MAPHETPLFDSACDRSCCTQGPRCFPVAKTTGISRRTHSRSTSQIAKKQLPRMIDSLQKLWDSKYCHHLNMHVSCLLKQRSSVFNRQKIAVGRSSMIQNSQLLHLTVCFWQFVCWIHQGTILPVSGPIRAIDVSWDEKRGGGKVRYIYIIIHRYLISSQFFLVDWHVYLYTLKKYIPREPSSHISHDHFDPSLGERKGAAPTSEARNLRQWNLRFCS